MAVDETLRAKVERALRNACQPDDPTPLIQLDEVPPNKLAGQVLSGSFAQLSPSERQDRIWHYLDQELTPNERTRISFIVTDTPDEHAALSL